MSNDSKLLVGLVLGAAAGVVAGMLLAPESGKDTREKIKNSTLDLKDDLEAKLHDLSKKIKDLEYESFDEVKGKFNHVKQDVKAKYEAMANKMKDLEKELEAKLKSLKDQANNMNSSQA